MSKIKDIINRFINRIDYYNIDKEPYDDLIKDIQQYTESCVNSSLNELNLNKIIKIKSDIDVVLGYENYVNNKILLIEKAVKEAELTITSLHLLTMQI